MNMGILHVETDKLRNRAPSHEHMFMRWCQRKPEYVLNPLRIKKKVRRECGGGLWELL